MESDNVTVDPDGHYRELCVQVGHLFLTWATLETTLSGVLKLHVANAINSDENDHQTISLSSAIFGSMRYKNSRDVIKRVVSCQPKRGIKSQRLEHIFSHLAVIEKLRDYFAHQSIYPVKSILDGTWQISTLMTAKDIENVLFFQFETRSVEKAWMDVSAALTILTNREFNQPVLIDSLIGDDPLPPWQYKPSLLKAVHRSKASLPPGLRLQHPPSPP